MFCQCKLHQPPESTSWAEISAATSQLLALNPVTGMLYNTRRSTFSAVAMECGEPSQAEMISQCHPK